MKCESRQIYLVATRYFERENELYLALCAAKSRMLPLFLAESRCDFTDTRWYMTVTRNAEKDLRHGKKRMNLLRSEEGGRIFEEKVKRVLGHSVGCEFSLSFQSYCKRWVKKVMSDENDASRSGDDAGRALPPNNIQHLTIANIYRIRYRFSNYR